MSSSSIETTREQRRKDREERKKARNAQESVIQNGSVKREKTPRKHKLGSELSVGSNVHKKPPSGLKYGQQSFDRVKIIEKTSSIEIPEKENKEKMTTENSEKTSSSTRRRLGNKFLDNLSKFESHTVKDEKDKKEKNAFIRSYRSQNQDAGAPFRRSYRPPKSSTVIEDPVLMTRRSLRKERVAESIAKLEQNKTKLKPVASSPSSSRKRTAESPYAAKSTSVSSRPSSAGSTKTFSDSGSSTSSSRKLSRAEQAIERHKDRMRKTSRTTSNASITSSPGSPGASKFRISSSDSLPKTPKQKQTKETTPLKTQKSEEKLRKISVTKSPLDGGAVEITTVTELTSPTKEKMNIIVKERASSIEDVFEITGEVTEPERKSDEPRPISVSDAVALFSGDDKSPTGAKPLKSSEETNQQKTKRTRRKLPDITTVESQQKKSQGGARERRRQSKHSKAERKHSSQPEDGSGEPKKQLIEQNMIIVETSPSQELKTSKKKKSKKSSNAKLAPTFSQPSPNKTELEYEETDAIEVLRRLSEEVSSSDVSARSLGTDMHSSMTRSSMDEILIIEEEEVTLEIEDTTNRAFSIDNISEEILAATNERPTTLEIDEILCIAPTPEIALEEISQALVTPEKAPSVESPLKSPVKQLSVEEKVQLSFTPTQEVLSLQSPVAAQQLVTDREEMAGRKNLIRKSTISWLDDWSDDDDVSVLSDASTSDLEIDYEWLGITDSEDDDYIPKSINIRSKLRKFSNSSPKIITQSTPEPKKSAQIERVTSKAADMMALWERKAAEPTNSPSRARNIASEIRVGSVKAAWEDQDKKIRIMSVQEEDDGSMSNGTGKSDEMKGLFDSKISGKIQGAKALFETLAQTSPVLPRSPSINRSPVIRKQERKASLHSSDNSPLISRQSSIAENISEENGHDDSSDSSARSPDNFQNIDNVRAMFENDTISQKQTPGKHKMSLADIVSDVNDDCDITDVRSVKAMWESMDNHSYKKSPKKVKKKSTIEKKVAAKDKKRRSMTQPVTTLDVMEAQSMIKDNDDSSDEIEVKVKDRLKFFAQLSTDGPGQKFEIRQRTRSASHRIEVEEVLNKKKNKLLNETSDKAEKVNFKNKGKLLIIPSGSSDNESLLSSSSTSLDEPDSKTKKYLSEEEMSAIAEIKATGSIHERLKLLQRNESEEKKKRNGKISTGLTSSLSERLNKLKSNEDKWRSSSSNSKIGDRVGALSNRIAKIKEDSETWKERKGKQNDAAQFTTQAKIAKKEGKMAISVLPSPPIKRRVLPASLPNHVTEKEAKSGSDSTSMNQLSFVEKLSRKGLEENILKTTEVRTTEVPTIDEEEFEKFFGMNQNALMNGDDRSSVVIDELPDLKSTAILSDLGRLKSNVQKASKRKPSSRNPLKTLAARDDIKLSYDEERTNITRLEQQRIAQRGFGANFTSAALAGLAAKADLSKVRLRSSKNTPMPSSDDLKPFKDVMLLRVKGRRQVQTRLVEPCPKSLSTDDAFLLITPKKLYGWFGELCNIIERAKVNEIADYIIRKGDLGCKVSSLISIEEFANQARYKEFWDVLGGIGEWDKVTSPGADEQFEIDATATIKTYKMIDSKLIPHEESWGKLPKMGMLGPSDTYVFDFGSEMYIWQGKEVSFADRRLAVRLSRVIWDQGYDFTEFGVCTFFSSELKGKRPEYGLFARVNENLETSLFQEKFEDWSNIYREVGEDEAVMRETNRGKVITENTTKSEIVNDAKPCDVKKMVEGIPKAATMVADGFDISGGDGEIVDEDGRILKILTEEVETFHVSENSVESFNDSVLHRSNSYVVRWKYTISSTGKFENSKTATSKSDSSNGRSRVAYFAWAGVNSVINDKGTSALIAANMDTGDGSLKIIDEATAPPVFSKCFHGNLLIIDGKRGERKGAYEWKLFKICGDTEESASLVQVRCNYKSLRSCSSFVFLLPRDSTTVIWHGCRSPKHVREIIEKAVDKLNDRMPGSIPFRRNPTSLNITICEEGKENEHFKEAVGSKRRGYECLLDAVDLKHRNTRAWKFVIQSGSVAAVELCPLEQNSLFPLVQEQLYEVEQPSLIFIDSMFGVYFWQNCSPAEISGSAKRRWDVTRRLAMETALIYCKENDLAEAKLIEAGHEPSTLTNAFPSWTIDETKKHDVSIQIPRNVSKVLSTLSRLTYTLDELRSDDLPDGVDPCHLETYLTNSDFEKLFGMTKNEFYQFPPWKQTQLRKQKKFF